MASTHSFRFASCGPASIRVHLAANYNSRAAAFRCPPICHRRRITSLQAGLQDRTSLSTVNRALRGQSIKICRQAASRLAVVAAADRQDDSQEPEAVVRGEFGLILRLGAVSFAGAAFIKYGELALGNLPYSHSLPVSLTMIIAPCVLFSIILALKSR